MTSFVQGGCHSVGAAVCIQSVGCGFDFGFIIQLSIDRSIAVFCCFCAIMSHLKGVGLVISLQGAVVTLSYGAVASSAIQWNACSCSVRVTAPIVR